VPEPTSFAIFTFLLAIRDQCNGGTPLSSNNASPFLSLISKPRYRIVLCTHCIGNADKHFLLSFKHPQKN
jgi:hypothetical protein